MKCNQCESAYINGIYCHELGCPEAWRDHYKDCWQCGCEFRPENRFQTVCNDCDKFENEHIQPEEFEEWESEEDAIYGDLEESAE